MKKLLNFFYCAFFVNIGLVLCLGIFDTQNNLPAGKMLLFPAIVVMVILVGCLLVSGVGKRRLERVLRSRYTLIVFLISYFILLSVISLSSKAVPDNDHLALYNGALYMAGVAPESNWEYFARCDNNTFPMLLLSIVIRVNQFFGFSEPYVLAILLNTFQVTVVMYCIYRILDERDNREYSFIIPWMGMGFVAVFLPVIGHTQSVYTDAMSFSFSVTAYYVWKKAGDKCKEKNNFFWLLLSGILWGVGASIKMTVLISFIAVFCFLLVDIKTIKTKMWMNFLVVGITITLSLLATQGITKSQPSQEMKDIYGLPADYWIGIGILGNGGYVDNQEYSIHLQTIYGMKEKAEYSQKYIREHFKNFADLNHISAKAKYNFASGNLGSSDFMRQTENRNFFFECISSDGKYFWRFSMINASLFYGMQILLLVGILFKCRRLKKEKCIDELHVITVLIVNGIGIYLMIFEANNRQLYNHYGWFAIGAALGIEAVLENVYQARSLHCRHS